ncbi:hypothetical protein LOD99_10603 [Oopsacas minuta]|uniref:Tetraspanin n=1 Tax=Oopsacas minuta TaxID=111878 RepID=A0AAV7KI33_9METZ|nr:hypothetical protein LOD99_10603 [Oopsacas minuta]
MNSESSKKQKVANLVQAVLSVWLFFFGIISAIMGAYGHMTTNHYASLNHSFSNTPINLIDYSSGANLLITAGVIQVLVAILGILGSFIGLLDGFQRIGIGFMIAYAVLLLVISGLNLSSSITAYGGYDDFENGAIELLKRLYLDYIGDAISIDHPANVLDGFQIRLSCCGLWGYTDYTTLDDLKSDNSITIEDATSSALELPASCCPSSVTVCNPINAYTIGCMPRMHEFIYQACFDGSSGLNCIFSALIDVESKLFAVFVIGLFQALVSMFIFVGTLLQIIYSVNFFKNILHDIPHLAEQQYYPEDTRAPSPTPVNVMRTPELI